MRPFLSFSIILEKQKTKSKLQAIIIPEQLEGDGLIGFLFCRYIFILVQEVMGRTSTVKTYFLAIGSSSEIWASLKTLLQVISDRS